MKLTWRRVQDGYQQAGKLERAIVAKRVPILAGLGIIAGELVRDGVIPDGLANGVTHWSTVTFTAAGVIGGVLWAQKGTTPADPQLQPKDIHGNPLVSALDVGPHAGIDASTDVNAAFSAAEAIQANPEAAESR